jgi:CBS domain-containing protein
MKCTEFMNVDLQWVPGASSVVDASRLMRDRSLGFLLVSDPVPGQAVGVVTDRDLTIRVCAAGLDPKTVRVGDVATLDLVVCPDHEDVKVAEALMRENQKSRLVVVDANLQIVGLISLTDILRTDHGKGARQTADAVLSRDGGAHHPPLESIHLTPSTVAEEDEAASHASVMVGGDHRGSTREFP